MGPPVMWLTACVHRRAETLMARYTMALLFEHGEAQ